MPIFGPRFCRAPRHMSTNSPYAERGRKRGLSPELLSYARTRAQRLARAHLRLDGLADALGSGVSMKASGSPCTAPCRKGPPRMRNLNPRRQHHRAWPPGTWRPATGASTGHSTHRSSSPSAVQRTFAAPSQRASWHLDILTEARAHPRGFRKQLG
jgi:hypothetical protein